MDDEVPAFDALWDYDDPEGTEQRLQEQLSQLAEGSALRVELLTQIARAQGLQRHFEEAHGTLDEVEARLTDEQGRGHIRYMLERGRVLRSSGHPEQARPFFLSAWEWARELDEEFYAVDAAHMLGIIEPMEEQPGWNLRALALAQQAANPHTQRWLGSLYNNIGWSYYEQGKFEQALEIFQQALTWYEQEGRAAETRIARWSIGRTLRSIGRVTEALELQRTLLAESETSGEPDGYIYEEIAECLLALGRAAEARPYFARAYEELSGDSGMVAHEPMRLERLRTRGQAL